MKDEIKESINRIQGIVDFYKLDDENNYDYSDDVLISMKRLLDYITNLQEENIKLKELCDKYEEEHNNAFKLWTMKMEEMPDYEERMNYKLRNEKAIEFMKENCDIIILNNGWIIRSELTTTGLGKLFKILQGSDKE